MDALQESNKAEIKTRSASLEDLTSKFINSLEAKPTTANTYKKALNQFIKWLLDNGIYEIGREDLTEYKRFLMANYSAATVSSYITALKTFYKWLEAERITPNIAATLKGAKTAKGFKKDTLTPEQAKRILSNIDRGTLDGLRDYALFNLLLRSGVRTIEAQRANINDMHQTAGQTILYIQGKGRDSKDDFIILTPATLEPIQAYIKAREEKNSEAALFISHSRRNNGERLTVRSISRIIKNAMRSAGIDSERLTAHSLRHSAITYSLLGGATLQEAQQLARHTSILTTTIYAHNINRLAAKTESKIDMFLDAAEE